MRRGTIFLEDAEILEQTAHPGRQFVLRVRAPRAAAAAEPGSFAHIACDPSIPLRRPLSIMRAERQEGWLEFLYKPVGAGLEKLSRRAPGEAVSMLAPIGRGFAPDPARPRVVAIGGGVGIPPMVFVADRLRHDRRFEAPLVLMGSEVPFPFETLEASRAIEGLPSDASHVIALLEAWSVPSRLASNAALPGAHRGFVTTLARRHLETLGPGERRRTQLLACGPEPMLEAVAKLAAQFDLPCQIAVEEYMACGVGGCAGCTVLVQTASGPAMKRVCVDGPVFEAREIYSGAFEKTNEAAASRS
ncbi:MAG TPA: dihydroorotate dehydrogenase electron transfer subunit [Gammaproteobacteria bacterium]|nr:dihydroorotate dehydrogenase electron transfer subunit [Gammaproteobacteria bacterium]